MRRAGALSARCRTSARLCAPARPAVLALRPAAALLGCGQPPSRRPLSTTTPEQPLFSKLELRVGEIVKVWEHETADRLWCEEIDVGEGAPRQIASGLRLVYSDEQMLGQRLVVVCNLKPRKLMGFKSHGMVLCAMAPPAEEGGPPGAIEFVEPPEGAALGDRISLTEVGDEGFPEAISAAQVKKQKVWEQIQPLLSTDDAGVVMFDGTPLAVVSEDGSAAVLAAPTIRNGLIS